MTAATDAIFPTPASFDKREPASADAIGAVAAERLRQVDIECHDRQLDDGQQAHPIAHVAAVYTSCACDYVSVASSQVSRGPHVEIHTLGPGKRPPPRRRRFDRRICMPSAPLQDLNDMQPLVRIARILLTPILCVALAGCWPWDDDDAPKKTPQGQGRIDTQPTVQFAQPKAPPAAPTPKVSQDAIDFGSLPLGAPSPSRTVMVSNDAEIAAPLKLALPTSPAFNASGSCLSTSLLSPRQRCDITVVFQARQPGAYADMVALTGTSTVVRISGIVPAPVAVARGPSYDEIQRLAVLSSAQTSDNLQTTNPAAAMERITQQGDFTAQGWDRLDASLPVDLHNVIMRGTPIVFSTIEFIDSQLGCSIRGLILEDVYGTIPGPYPLLAKGSIMTAECAGVAGQDQSRMPLIVDRILTPDNRVINIDSAVGDGIGRAGLAGAVDNQFWQRYGKSLLISMIGVGATYAAAKESGNQNETTSVGAGGLTTSVTITPEQQAAQSLQSDLSNISQSMLADGQHYQTRLYIPEGTIGTIFPRKDIWFANSRIMPVPTPASPDEIRAISARQNGRAQAVQYSDSGTVFEPGNGRSTPATPIAQASSGALGANYTLPKPPASP